MNFILLLIDSCSFQLKFSKSKESNVTFLEAEENNDNGIHQNSSLKYCRRCYYNKLYWVDVDNLIITCDDGKYKIKIKDDEEHKTNIDSNRKVNIEHI